MKDKYKKEAIKNMRKTPYAQDRDRDFWTDDERNQLKKMFNAGEDLSEIALVLQRTELAFRTARSCWTPRWRRCRR